MTNLNGLVPKYNGNHIALSDSISDILNNCFVNTNMGNIILDFYTKNYNIINITNGSTVSKRYGNYFIEWDCDLKGKSIFGYYNHLQFIKDCSSKSNTFTKLLKLFMDFDKYNRKHAHLMQIHKESKCYGNRKEGSSQSITISSFVKVYGKSELTDV